MFGVTLAELSASLGDPVLALGLAALALLLLAIPISFWMVSGGSNSAVVTLLVALANLVLTAQ